MLVELHVIDLGIVSDLSLVLEPGLTAITGETGAGKTLIVEALDLLLGGRADTGLVRDGAAEAAVEGRFVDPASGEETVLARVLPRDGRSRAYADGHLVTAADLARLGARFVDLHGQHAHQSLLDPAVQRNALDRFAGAPALDALDRYRAARAELREVDDAATRLGGDARSRAHEIDLLRFQLGEIDDAALGDPDEDGVLEAEESLLADATAHREAVALAYEALVGPGRDALGDAVHALEGRAPFADLFERARAIQADVDDVAHVLRLTAEQVVDDPERLAAVQARRRRIRELCRKYGDTGADVLRFADSSRARLAELESYGARADELDARRRTLERSCADAAAALTAARRGASAPLARAVERSLRELAMPAAALTVDVEPAEQGDDGADRVTYLLAPNPGESPRPLARAASGGELSRAMLALRVVLTAAPPTLVFDEVDAGIGGEAGRAVGRLLATLGRRHQVLCVTHLPQVAAFGDAHVVVEKHVVVDRHSRRDIGSGPEQASGPGERTVASARTVDGDARVGELSRMLAGVGTSDHAREHARELLESARTVVTGAGSA